jgi:adenosylhomocysteine nucleosidase
MTSARIAELVDRAFDYRGYVTLRRSDGSELVAFVFDRGPSHVEVLDESATKRLRIPVDDIADIAFTGDDAAQKSQEIWERRKGKLEPRETPAHGGWEESRPLLVAVALAVELRSVARALGRPQRGGVVRGRLGGMPVLGRAIGMGAKEFLRDDQARAVLCCGFSGALDPSLRAGDLVLATAVRNEQGEVAEAPEALRSAAAAALSGRGVKQGEILCATSVAASAEEKHALAATGAIALDMESWSVARAAQEAGIPWLALRAIVDPLSASMPDFTRTAHDSYLVPALKHALRGPRAALGLLRLARAAQQASSSLEEALRRVVPALEAAA